MGRSMGVWMVVVVLGATLVACGGRGANRSTTNGPRGSARAEGTTAAQSFQPAGGDGSAERPYLLCHDRGGPRRTDYGFIANQRCGDGTMPLAGDPERGANARLGNVGEGPDGHIVDLYEIPCARPVRIYVDAYHCASGSVDIDPNNLSPEQLSNTAQLIRRLHRDHSARAHELRGSLLTWAIATTQLSVVVCESLADVLPTGEAPRPWHAELLLSYVAAIIEDGHDPAEPVSTTARALRGLATYYEACLAEDPSVRDERLDQLLAAARAGSLEQVARRVVGGCDDWSGMGLHR